MSMINGRDGFIINVLFYENLTIQMRRLTQKLKMYFDEKDITLDVHFSTTDYTKFSLYFFKDKTIQGMEKYIISALKEKNKYEDYNIYDKSNADMRRDIDLEGFPMWNGQSITSEINLRLLILKHIQSSQYYGRMKPNYDKNIDKKLSDTLFNKEIESFIEKDLSYPFGVDFKDVETEKQFVYSKDNKWHANFLYETRVNLEKYNLAYSLFDKIYKKSKDFYIKDYNTEEQDNNLSVAFKIIDKKDNEYSLIYIFEKTEENKKRKYNGEEMFYLLPKYIIKHTTKILITKTDDKNYKKLITKFEDIFS